MLRGYVRGVRQDQTLEVQRRALKEAGCTEIHEDQLSSPRAERSGLKSVMEILGAGDTLMVWRLDRLGCSTKELCAILRLLDSRGIHFRSLADDIDTAMPNGPFFFHLMGVLWQMERELTAERARAGVDNARQRGRSLGRRRLMTEKKIEKGKKLLAGGVSPRDVAKRLQVSIPTLYRWLPATTRLSESMNIELTAAPGLSPAVDDLGKGEAARG